MEPQLHSQPINVPVQSAAVELPRYTQPLGLSELFDCTAAAPCLIRSDDKTLSRQEIPKAFAQIPEGELIWEMHLHPSKDLSQILARQKLIETLVGFEKTPALKKLKDVARGIKAGHDKLYEQIATNDYGDSMPAIEIYRRGSPPAAIHRATENVESGLRMIEVGCEALSGALTLLWNSKEPTLHAIAPQLEEALIAGSRMSREYFTGESFKFGESFDWAKIVHAAVLQFGAAVEFAELCKRDKLGQVTFDSQRPVHYTGAFSYLCPESAAHRNDSPAEHENTVLAGANMSGKTESGLKLSLMVRLMAQTFGYSSLEDGNFHLHDSFFYLDRTHSEPQRKLSAFGSEMANLKEMCGILGSSPFGCFDELGSTTSPEDQLKFLYALGAFLAEKKGRGVFATHNEHMITLATRLPGYGIYHFDITIKDNGSIDYSYRLTPGPADSNSIKIAQSLKFDPQFINDAVSYTEGAPLPVERPRDRKFRKVEQYSEAERSALKMEAHSGKETLFSSKGRFFLPFSQDRQMQAGSDFFSSAQFPVSGEDGWWHRKSLNVFMRDQIHGGAPSWITEMVFNGGVLDSKRLHERQHMFEALSQRDCYEKLKGLHREILWGMEVLPHIARSPSLLMEFNRHLNPFGALLHLDNQEKAHVGAAYLRFNQKILGERFPFPRELAAAERLDKTYQDLWNYASGLSITELGRITSDQRAELLDDEYTRLFREVGSAEKSRGVVPERPTVGDLEQFMNPGDETSEQWRLKDARREHPAGKKLASFLHERVSPRINGEEIIESLSAHLAELGAELSLSALLNRLHSGELTETAHWAVVRHIDKINHAVAWLPAPSHLASRVTEVLLDPITGGEEPEQGRECLTLSGLANCTHRLEQVLSVHGKMSWRLPAVPLFLAPLEDAREEIKILTSAIRARHDVEKSSSHPQVEPAHVLAVALDLWMDTRNVLGDFLKEMRSYDAVPLHQLAHSIEQGCSDIGAPLPSRYSDDASLPSWARDSRPDSLGELKKHLSALKLLISEKQHAALRAQAERGEGRAWKHLQKRFETDDLRKPLRHLATAFDRTLRAKVSEFQQFENEMCEAHDRFPWMNESWCVDDLRSYLKGGAESLKNVTSLLSSLAHITGSELPDRWHGESCDRNLAYLKELVEASAISPRIKEWEAWENDIAAREQAFAKRVGLALEKRKSVHLAVAEALRKEVAILSSSVMRFSWNTEFESVQKDLTAACTLALYGRHVALNNWTKVTFNTEGRVKLEGLKSVFDSESVPQNFSAEVGHEVRILSGPQMSGKTYHEKSATAAICCALSTGFAPATHAETILFDGAVFLDRITGKDDQKLSAAGNEFRTWGKMLEAVRPQGTFWLAIDEAFSTLSPRYQEAFTWAAVQESIRGGHYTSISMHNHQAIDAITRLQPEVSVWHFGYHIDNEALIHFERELKKGHAPSEAVPVARALGVDSRILELAESVPAPLVQH